MSNINDTRKAHAYDFRDQVDLGYCTAKQIAYLLLEGVNVYAPAGMWRRINKHLKKMGVGSDLDLDFSIIDIDAQIEIDSWIGVWLALDEIEVEAKVNAFIEEVNLSMEKEVEVFLEDMYLMNLLDGPDPEEESE